MVRPGRPVERAWRDLVSLATLEWLAQPSRNTRKVTFVRLYSSCIATHTTPMRRYCYPNYPHATVWRPYTTPMPRNGKCIVRIGVAAQLLNKRYVRFFSVRIPNLHNIRDNLLDLSLQTPISGLSALADKRIKNRRNPSQAKKGY